MRGGEAHSTVARMGGRGGRRGAFDSGRSMVHTKHVAGWLRVYDTTRVCSCRGAGEPPKGPLGLVYCDLIAADRVGVAGWGHFKRRVTTRKAGILSECP